MRSLPSGFTNAKKQKFNNMKILLFILMVFAFAACNNYEDESFQNCIGQHSGEYDTIHIQSVPYAAEDLYNLGYDTSKALVILPPDSQ